MRTAQSHRVLLFPRLVRRLPFRSPDKPNVSLVTIIRLVILALVSSCVAQGDDWKQFAGPMNNFQIRQTLNLEKASQVSIQWQQTLGAGMSGSVVESDWLYTTYLVPFDKSSAKVPESERPHREAIVALDRRSGRVRWLHTYDVAFLESQQAFGGRSRAPQATPCIAGDSLYAIGFTGLLHAMDRVTGEVKWKADLVDRFDAVPVQFGFSASPLVAGDRLFVLAGGAKGGMVCLRTKDGGKIWSFACDEASYATPLLWNCRGEQQIVFMTRKSIVGVLAATGEMRWRYELPKSGLTNVPTPLVVDDTSLIVSGQGVGGCCRIMPEKRDGSWTVKEVWKSSEQFFYCNWILRKGVLLGCAGDLLIALNTANGERIGRWRGYADSNLVATEDAMLILDGKGSLSMLRFGQQSLDVFRKVQVLDARCWVPPVLVDEDLYCRGDDQLVCLALNSPSTDALPEQRVTQREMKWTLDTAVEPEAVDAITQILRAYETSEESAWATYKSLRKKQQITRAQREQLASLAKGEGAQELAKTIERHIAEDYPESGDQRNDPDSSPNSVKKPSRETHRAENGLLYIEFGIRNQSLRTLHAVVQGPPLHPFGYGLPLRPGKIRIEKWPVGTKLYRQAGQLRGELLIEVGSEMSGQVLEVK